MEKFNEKDLEAINYLAERAARFENLLDCIDYAADLSVRIKETSLGKIGDKNFNVVDAFENFIKSISGLDLEDIDTCTCDKCVQRRKDEENVSED